MAPASVSVMIPAYNGARYLREALESVVAQQGVPFEVVLIDDASTDDTPAIARSFAQVTYVRNPGTLGLPANFNRCVELARAPLMCVFCQDDLMEPGNLARKTGWLERHPDVALAASNARILDDPDGGRKTLWNYDLSGDQVYEGRRFLRRLILGDNPIALSGAVFRTGWARDQGGFDVRFPQTLDWHFWLRLALRHDIAYLSAPLVSYRSHPHTATRRHGAFLNIRDVYQAKIDLLHSAGGALPGRDALEDQFRTHFGKGLLASSARAWIRGERPLARDLFRLVWRVAPDLAFIPKAVLLGLLQSLLRRRLYSSGG